MRIRRMDNLERAVKDAQKAIAEEASAAAQRPPPTRAGSSRSIKGTEEIGKLKSENKILKAELKFHRQHPSAMAQQMLHQQAQTNPEHARRVSGSGSSIKSSNSPARQFVSQLLRHHSTSAVEQLQERGDDVPPTYTPQPLVVPAPQPPQPGEQRWIHRLKELERRLKAEREARLLDRRGARQRLEEGRLENEELRLMLEHERVRREMSGEGSGSVAGSERVESEGNHVSSGVD